MRTMEQTCLQWNGHLVDIWGCLEHLLRRVSFGNFAKQSAMPDCKLCPLASFAQSSTAEPRGTTISVALLWISCTFFVNILIQKIKKRFFVFKLILIGLRFQQQWPDKTRCDRCLVWDHNQPSSGQQKKTKPTGRPVEPISKSIADWPMCRYAKSETDQSEKPSSVLPVQLSILAGLSDLVLFLLLD